MVGWHHQLSGHEFEQTLGDSEGQGSRVCCSSGLQRVERLNNSNGLLSSMDSINNSSLCSHGLFPLLCNQLPFRENSSAPCPYWYLLPQAEQHPPHQPCPCHMTLQQLSLSPPWAASPLGSHWTCTSEITCSPQTVQHRLLHPTLGLLIFFKGDKLCTHLY